MRFFSFFQGSLHSGRSKVTRVTVGRDTDQRFRACKVNLATPKRRKKSKLKYEIRERFLTSERNVFRRSDSLRDQRCKHGADDEQVTQQRSAQEQEEQSVEEARLWAQKDQSHTARTEGRMPAGTEHRQARGQHRRSVSGMRKTKCFRNMGQPSERRNVATRVQRFKGGTRTK